MSDKEQHPYIIEAEHVDKVSQDQQILRDISLAVRRGSFIALMGPSGSGKSTLLSILGALDTHYSGIVRVAGTDLRGLRDDELTLLRRTQIGFVFQQFHLLPGSTVLQNVEMPLMFAGQRGSARRECALHALEAVNITQVERRPIAQLSGGERQRVAIARALVNNPAILLADEPTGSLDQATGVHILNLFTALNQTQGLTIFLVTHDPQVAQRADHIFRLHDGRLIAEDSEITLREVANAE